MQVHPLEVWDLLKLLGLAGRWGASEQNFLRFFEEVRSPFGQRDWSFLVEMMKDFLEAGGQIDPAFADKASTALGPVTWNKVQTLVDTFKSRAIIQELEPDARHVLDKMVRHHTPVRTFVWRNGRDLLHRYRERGILKERVPTREPFNEWIDFKPDEQVLYDRIEEYISQFYRKYEAQRKGLGFVMTVYRRRLTSSFHAARLSLERRREFLRGVVETHGLTDEDLEQDELGMDIGNDFETQDFLARDAELEYLDDFLSDLHSLAIDSKLEFLKRQLAEIFQTHDSAILFTQYTDTMDYLRDSLRSVYGSSVACYSGRGGESWDGERWIIRKKEEIKEEFRTGDTIQILLCTESASEGLNLQTCGVLINYDMPWNPMRVEQRIGRIDRIGQKYDVVHIHNYFFRDTVEAVVYDRLSDRIDWFEHVVGNLQPILHDVGRAISKLAMMERHERDQKLEPTLAEIRKQADGRDENQLDLDALVDETVATSSGPESPVTLSEIEQAFLTSDLTRSRFWPHPSISGAYWLDYGGSPRAVTFRSAVFDQHPYTVELMTYGNPTFDGLLDEVAGSDLQAAKDVEGGAIGGAILLRDTVYPPVAVCVVKNQGDLAQVATMSAYQKAAVEHETKWTADDRGRARAILDQARADLDESAALLEQETVEAKRRALRDEARRILFQGAHILEVQEGFFTGIGETAVDRLCRKRPVPYRGLRSILVGDVPAVSVEDTYREQLARKPTSTLSQMMGRLSQRGVEVLRDYAELR